MERDCWEGDPLLSHLAAITDHDAQLCVCASPAQGAVFTARQPTPAAAQGIRDGNNFPCKPGQRGFATSPGWHDIKLPIIGHTFMNTLAAGLNPLAVTGATVLPTEALFDLTGPHAPLDDGACLSDTTGGYHHLRTPDGPRGLRQPSPLRSPERMKV